MQAHEQFYQEMIQLLIEKGVNKKTITTQKIKLCKKYNLQKIPTDIQLLLHATPEQFAQLQLVTKPMRTQSGVAPIALMTAPHHCPHGKCTFCPGGINSPFGDVPQSYTGHEPSTMRGIRNNYDSYLMTMNRLEQYTILGHCPQKAEVIIMGGTFPAMPKEYQEEFVINTFKALNDFSKFYQKDLFDISAFKTFFELPGEKGNTERVANIKKKLLTLKTTTTLLAEQEKNEQAHVRCVGLTIETKPDWGFAEHGNTMLRLGCTRVELGIESVYDDVLTHVHRGHTVADTKKSIRELKDLGFKIHAHYMPGLPLTTKEMDIEGMKQLFSNPDFRPDMLKLYPTMVSPGTGLWHDWKQGKFTPLTTEEASKLISEFKPFVPEYCRIMRVQRDVPTKFWSAGVSMTNLRQHIFETYKPNCRCIRCREPGMRQVEYAAVQMHVQEYAASKGTEFFISFDDTKNDLIIGFCRMRFPSQCLREEITKHTALIRELHVYGTATALGNEGILQHRGYGKQLLQKAEEIARLSGKKKMVVIAGIGVREYYYKQGYTKEGPYVSKEL